MDYNDNAQIITLLTEIRDAVSKQGPTQVFNYGKMPEYVDAQEFKKQIRKAKAAQEGGVAP